MKMLPKRDYLTCKILIFNLNLSLKHSTFFFSCIPCTSQWPVWKICSHISNQGIDLETCNSESETSNNGLAILVSFWWAGTPRTVTASTFIPWCTDPSLVPHWLSTMGLQSSQTVSLSLSKPKSHRVLFHFPSNPKSTFSTRTLVYPFSNILLA